MSTLLGLLIGFLALTHIVSAQDCTSCSYQGTRLDSNNNSPRCTCNDNSVGCGQARTQCLCNMGYTDVNCGTQVGSGAYECSAIICGSWYENIPGGVTWVEYNNAWCCQTSSTVGTDFCNPSPCVNGNCDSQNNRCDCFGGWTGTNCDVPTQTTWCSAAQCNTYQNVDFNNPCNEQFQQCNCLSGWGGQYCQQPQWCANAQCNQYQNVDFNNPCDDQNQRCNCLSGWTGQYCQQQVQQQWCANAQCNLYQNVDVNNPCDEQNQRCNCLSGWTGQYCQQQVQQQWCTSAQCNFYPNVDFNNPCNEQFQQCNCLSGWGGQYCQQQVTQQWCTTAQCNLYPNVDFNNPCNEQFQQCTCLSGWTGQYCQQRVEPTYCSVGGAQCAQFANVDVNNPCNEQLRQCNCYPGWSGEFCQQQDVVVSPEFRCDLGLPQCYNGGTCDIDRVNLQTQCLCPPQYQQFADCAGVFFCTSGKCQNGGQCDELADRCNCFNGYTGVVCEVAPQGACVDNNQCNGGTCFNSQCICPTGQFGRNCESRVGDSCDSSYCSNNQGVCTYDGNGNQQCTCNPGWIGTLCGQNDPCYTQTRCFNGGTCKGLDSVNFECRCPSGWGGPSCEVSTDPCSPNPCSNGGQCTEIAGSNIACSCPNNDYVGDRCEIRNWCKGVNCNNRGSCINDVFTYRCECNSDYTGTNCETLIETTVNNCNNRNCNNRGTCVNQGNVGICQCNIGFKGDDCELIDHCAPNPCGFLNEFPNNPQNDGICYEDTALNTFACDCPAGWGNVRCETNLGVNDPCFDDLFNPKCQNGGICRPWYNPDAPFPYWFSCFCTNGYSGELCELRQNPCSPVNPCGINGVCVQSSIIGTPFICSCNQGWKGDLCDERDFCDPNPCGNGATCFSTLTSFSCNCPPNAAGVLCDQFDFCAQAPSLCKNGGTCNNLPAGPQCACTSQWSGNTCEQAVANACTNVVCQNGGTCVLVGSSGFRCNCRSGWRGTNCQLETVQPCDSSPCKNQAIKCDNINNNSDFVCTCSEQWTGKTCTVIFTTRPPRRTTTTRRPIITGTDGLPITPKPTTKSVVEPAANEDDDDLALSKGVIVAIAIAGLALLVGFIRLMVYCCQRGSGKH